MKIEKKYKLDVQEGLQSSSKFSDIEDRVNCAKPKASVFNWKLGLGFTLGAAATAALVIGFTTNMNSTATGALAYQMSPIISKEVAVANVSPQSMLKPAMAAPLMKKSEDKNVSGLEDILYEVDALITNKNEYKIKDIDSDKEEYANAQLVKFTLLNGEDSEYILYYNDAVVNSVEKKNKKSSEQSFEGLAVAGGIEMTFTYESKEEVKNNKSSFSSITTIYENIDKTDYLVITSESEVKKNKEQEGYKYEHFVNNTLEDTYSISYNVKKNKSTVTVVTADEEYTIEKKVAEKKEMFSIHVSGKNGNKNIKYVKVVEENGSVEYAEENE